MYLDAPEAVSDIKSGDNIFIHSACAAPEALIQALTARGPELSNVSIYQLHTEGPAPYAEEREDSPFIVKALFVGGNTRKAIRFGKGSYIPVFLSEIPNLFRRRIIDLDHAFISVSPPDNHGFCSLGPSVDVSLAAVKNSKKVIAQVNNHMPRSHGDGMIHIDEIDVLVESHRHLPEVQAAEITESEMAIGRHIAELIEDGATLQMGIGSIPNAVLNCLGNHKDLGIHSEMFSDGVLPLVEKGVITGKYKKKHPGAISSSFALGTKKLFDFIHDNPGVKMLTADYTNNPSVIRKNPKVTAINSAIEIDLTGQVCADSIGPNIYSGVGGQMDFIRGASLSEGGKPIIALNSVTGKGRSKIVPFLQQGAGVVTTRAHVHYVVTEWGVANLYGRSVEDRIDLLIGIAHPDHREELSKGAKAILS